MNKLFRILFKHSTTVIIITFVLTAFFAFSMRKLEIDPSPETLIPEHNEVTQLLKKYGADSSSTGYFLIAVESDDPFRIDALQALEKAIYKIEELPGIKSGINPFSTFTFNEDGKRLSINTMAPGGRAPENEEELMIFKQNIIGNPFYTGSLISENGKILCVAFPCRALTDEADDFMAAYAGIKAELEEYYKVYTTGDAPISDRSNQYIMKDLFKLFTLAMIFMLVSFFIGFKTKRSFLLPMSVITMGTVWTLGFMALLKFQVNIISLTIPPLVLTIGSSYTIHVLNQYYRSSQPDAEDKSWIADATIHINKTILLACLTTIVGFLSLLLTSLSQTREFGLATSFGIFSTMILSIFYLPAVLFKISPPSAKHRDNVTSGLFARMMGKLGLWVIRFRFLILTIFAVIILLSVYAYPRIPAQSDYLSYFPDDDVVVNETSYIIDNVGGYQTLYLTLTAPGNEPNFFLQQNVLRDISAFENEAAKDPDITGISSAAFFIRKLNSIMNGEDEIPANKALINILVRYLKLLRNSAQDNEVLEQLANDDFSQVTISMKVYNSKNNRILAEDSLRSLLNRMDKNVQSYLSEYNPEIWSVDMRYLYLSELLTRDQTISTISAIILVFIISAISFRSLKYGGLTLLPLICGLMLNFIFMAFMQIPLDMITLMVTSIVIGVGVDDAIHYNIQFRKNFSALNGDMKAAIEQTHLEAGRPIMHTTISIVGGLMFLLFSNFLGTAYFGLLICFTLTFTMLGTLILLPAVIAITIKKPDKVRKNLLI